MVLALSRVGQELPFNRALSDLARSGGVSDDQMPR